MPDYREWQCPPQAIPPERRLSWINEATEEGQAWLRSQRGYGDWRKALNIISGILTADSPAYRSQLTTNHLKRNIREVVGTLAKLRPICGYSSENPAYAESAEMLNKRMRAWYLEEDVDLSIKESLQYAAATCSGWIRPIYRRDMAGKGRGEHKLLTYGAPCIVPCQLPASGDFQQAYAVTILDEMPVYMAHAMFRDYQEWLTPTASMYWYSNTIREAAKGNLWKRMWGAIRSDANPGGLSDLMVPVRYTYVIDLSINETGKPIPMGEPGTTWAYVVPSVGQDIPVAPGVFRKATVNDARLYPRRRLLISSERVVMYDGPAFDWHGRVPAIPFKLDAWPWEPLGLSIVRGGWELQRTIDENERGMADKFRAQNDMSLAYDINSVSAKEAKTVDPMQPRGRYGFDGSSGNGQPFVPVVPPDVLMVRQEQLAYVDHLKNLMDEELAIKDLLALAKARMESDDIEKLLEATGPIVEDMSRSMEPPMRELGNQMKYQFVQYDDTARTMQYVGPDGVSTLLFDYNPSSLVPSHLPGESTDKDSPTPAPDRARFYVENMKFLITPRSAHELTQMSMKLGLVQLAKGGVMISSQTIAEAWNVPNYGTLPGATEMEKWKAEQELKLEIAARMQAIGQALSQAAEMLGPAAPMLAAIPPGAAAPGKSPEGRPPSGQQAPALKQKSDGRATVTESAGGGRVV